jgi:hypothetical protein
MRCGLLELRQARNDAPKERTMESLKTTTLYKVRRATTLLTLASSTLQTMQGKKRKELQAALEKTKEENFDFERLPDETVELLFAYFDEKLTKSIVDEYRFVPEIGNIRDLGATIGVCTLCGKGDSKDEGDNHDHLRFEFKLTNTAGGEDVWCGSTCIVKHHLAVDGAATSGEAKNILAKALRDHIAWWKIETWRAEHADHAEIPKQWEAVRFLPRDLDRWGCIGQHSSEIKLMGFDQSELRHKLIRLYRPFRSAVRFYARRGFLTVKKTPAWEDAKEVLRVVKVINRALREAQGLEGDVRFDWFEKHGKQLAAQAA